MTVSEFAVAMYGCDIVKDRVVVMDNDKILYDDRMEFLRYVCEDNPRTMWFAGKYIKSVTMTATEDPNGLEYLPDYIAVIHI